MRKITQIRICVDARLSSGRSGGVEQALTGLAASFSKSNFQDLHFSWLVNEGENEWLAKHIPVDSDLIEIPHSKTYSGLKSNLGALARSTSFGDKILSRVRSSGPVSYRLPKPPSIVTKMKIDVIHFPLQFGFSTNLPNIYQPHDFQHLHLPEYFSDETMALRTVGYTAMANQASVIVVGNEWTKKDMQSFFPAVTTRIQNVPVYPQPLPAETHVQNAKVTALGNYLFYPAMNWPHKNHLALVSALAEIKGRGHHVKLALSGARLESNTELNTLIAKLNLSEDVIILGFVSEEELTSYYLGAQIVVMPSLFESESIPVWEAFSLGIPVAASSVTAIPAQVGDAAMLFDPNSVQDIANKVCTILDDPTLAKKLVNLGYERVSMLTPENSALGYRYAYRQSLGLTDDEADKSWVETGFRF